MAQQKTRTFLLGRFEAGDRPTDQDFANLFESILFLNNGLSGHNNGISTDNTSIEGNFEIGGTLDLTGNFKMGAKLSVGNIAEALQSPISAYNTDNFAVYYASSSLSDIMFEGVSQDVTSSIKLTETLAGSTPAVPSTNTLIFGTSAGRAFLQNDGQEILHMTSSGHNGSSPQVYISGSLGIGSGWDSGTAATGEQLHIQALGEGDATMRLTSDGTANDSIIKLRQSDNVGFDLIYDGGADRFQIKENGGNNPFQIEHGASTNTLYLGSSGNVGIGLSNPTEKLHVKGTSTATNALVQTTTGNAIFQVQTSVSQFSLTGNGFSNQFTIYDENSANTPFKLEGSAPSSTLVLKSTGRIGLGTAAPESNLHIIGDPEGLIPMMLIEGGANVPEQDILILRDLGTADLNKNNIKFEATSGEHTISQIQAITRGSNATSGGDLNIFTYSDDSETKNANQLYLKNSGRIGIGTNTPDETLDVQGVINSTSEFSTANTDDEGEYRLGSRTDFGLKGTSYNAQLQAPNSVYVMIDSNADDDSSKFKINKHSSIVGGGTTLFTVDQSGGVTGSAFVGDGSQLTGISGAQITGFVTTPGTNRLITSNAAGDGVFGEENLTFDGTDLRVDGNIAIGKGTAGLFSADSPLHIKHTGDSLGNSDLIHLSMNSTTTEGNISIKLSDADDVSNQHFKLTFGEGSNDLKFHSDTVDNILYLEHDGDVGIGTNAPTYHLHVEDASDTQAYFKSTDDGPTYIRIDTSDADADTSAAVLYMENGGIKGASGYNASSDTIVITHDTGPNSTKGINIDSNGKVGIGTSAPRETLDVVGRITVDNSTSGVPAVTIFGEQDSSTHPDIQFNGGGVIAASGSLYMNIDADNSTTGAVFAINKNSNTNGATRVLTVNENGNIQLQDTAGTAMMSLSSQIDQSTNGSNYDGVFVGETDLRIHKISFPGAYNDSGFISHESQPNVNNAVLRLVPSDDVSGKDYVSIGGSAQIEGIRLFNSGEAHFRGGLAVGHLFNASGTSIAEEVAEGTIHVKTNTDASLWLEADVDNAGGEDHNAFIKLTHDNSANIFYLGTVGSADDTPEAAAATNTLANSLYIGSKTNHPIQLVTNNVARLTVLNDGNVGIGTSNPGAKLDVEGDIKVGSAITLFSAGVVASGPDIQFNGAGLIAAETHLNLNINSNGGSDDLFIRTGGDTNSATEIARFTNTGRLGLGGVDPGTILHIKSTNNEQIRLEDEDADGDPYISFYNSNTHRNRRAYIQSYNTSGTSTGNNLRLVSDVGSIQFFTSPVNGTYSTPVENFRVEAGGDVKMRHDKKLTLGGTLGAANDHGFIRFNYPSDSDSSFEIGTKDNSNEPIIFTQTDNERMGIYANGYVGIGINDPETFLSVKTNFSVVNSDFDTLPAAGSRLIMGLGATSGDTYSWMQAQDAGGGSNNNLILQRYGNYVGIGEIAPDELLTVKGASPRIHIKNTDETNGGIKFSDADAISTQQFELLYDSDTSSGGNLKFRSDNTDNILVMDPNGSIEIAGNLAVSGQTAGTNHPEFGGVTMALDATDENIGCAILYWNPDGKLQSNNVDTYGWRAYMGDFSSGTDQDLGFQSSKNGTTSINTRYITHGDSGQAFTGQHPCKPNRPLSIYQSKVGYIVSSIGTISNYPENWTEDTTTVDPLNSVTINESLPIVEMSDQPNDKKVYGVISQVDDPNSTERNNTNQTGGFNSHTSNRIDDRMAINSVGEGAIMVSNINGNLENGDYITTSHIEGIGMKQDDDLLHNYTVAKIVQDCDFSTDTTNVTHNGITYKSKLVGCTYHCG